MNAQKCCWITFLKAKVWKCLWAKNGSVFKSVLGLFVIFLNLFNTLAYVVCPYFSRTERCFFLILQGPSINSCLFQGLERNIVSILWLGLKFNIMSKQSWFMHWLLLIYTLIKPIKVWKEKKTRVELRGYHKNCSDWIWNTSISTG